MISFKRKNFLLLTINMLSIFLFRSLKLLEEKYIDAKKAFEVNKSQSSLIERRVLN